MTSSTNAAATFLFRRLDGSLEERAQVTSGLDGETFEQVYRDHYRDVQRDGLVGHDRPS